MIHHLNNGVCPKCNDIFEKYPDFNMHLRYWFTKLQSIHPEAHISCAGRGRIDQEQALKDKRSKANWLESAHNYNCAIDIFVIAQNLHIYDIGWFNEVIAPNITDQLEWYGAPHASFKELPHVEIKNWKELRDSGLIGPVE